MDRKMISEALGHIDEKYVVEALSLSGKAAMPGKENNMDRKSASKGARILLIAAVLAMALGITAGAYVGFIRYENPSDMMRGFFGVNDNNSDAGGEDFESGELRARLKAGIIGSAPMEVDEKVMERYVYPYVGAVDGSFSRGDYTVTMEACLYDKNILSGLLYYTVENPNGIGNYRLSESGYLELTNGVYVGLEYTHNIFVDSERSTDTKLYLCERFIVVPDWRERLDPKLSVGSGPRLAGISFEPVLEELEKTDVPGVEVAGGDIWLSPIGMAFKPEDFASKSDDIRYVALRFDDGIEYVVYDLNHLFINCVCSLNVDDRRINLFNSVIDINALVEVQIDEAVFKVE